MRLSMMMPPLHGAAETGHGGNLADGLLWGVAREHVPALVAALLMPFAWWAVLGALRGRAAAGMPGAGRLVTGWDANTLPERGVAFGLVLSAVVHLAVVPHHLAEDPALAAALVAQAALAGWLAYRSVGGGQWRAAAGLVLAGSIAAYLGVLLARTESPDEVGVATKIVELFALGLLLGPRRERRRFRRVRATLAPAGFVLLTMLTGATVWAVELDAQERAGGGTDGQHAMVGMVMQPDGWTEPTAADRAGADRLVTDTLGGIARYADVEVARAVGYRSTGEEIGPAVHFEHPTYMKDGVTLDPEHPEMLVYAVHEDQAVLLGAVYALNWPLAEAPDAGGGSLTSWHVHTNVCISPAGLVGLLSPFGTCPAFSINIAIGPMLHVWIVNLPNGPFGLEPTQEEIDALLGW